MSIYPYAPLSNPTDQWKYLKDINTFLQDATFVEQNGSRYIQKGEVSIPLKQVAAKIYEFRPCLACEKEPYLKHYFTTLDKFKALLPEKPEETSLLGRISACVSDCFWGCYCCIPLC